jgi:hypothetical protein
MKKVIALIFLIQLFSSLHAEDKPTKFKRTGIYGEFGIGDYVHLDLNLEHYFLNKKYWHLGARTGYGQYAAWSGDGGSEALLTLSGLLGKKYHFLELQTGGILLGGSKENNTSSIYPFVSGGYTLRYKHFLFRANVNTMIAVNAGLGFVF